MAGNRLEIRPGSDSSRTKARERTPMHYPEILAIRPDPVEFAYDDQFTMLYALGLIASISG
jgi:hypothetical protein